MENKRNVNSPYESREEWEKAFVKSHCDDLILSISSQIPTIELNSKEQEFYQYEFNKYKEKTRKQGIFYRF